MNAPDVVRAAHPFVEGEGFYAGCIICDTCHLVVLDPEAHLAAQFTPTPTPTPKREPRRDPRESQIDWETP